jgi:hypothetical protein
MRAIETIEWHDLPIKSISIEEKLIRLEVMLYNETSEEYDANVLEFSDFETIELSINGSLDPKTLDELEVADFDYKIEGELISGKLQILPGNAGFWEISVTNSKWTLCERST